MWDASISALLVATILWATLALAESERMRDWCAYGLLWGVTLMVNATLAALLPLLLGWLAYRRHLVRQEWIDEQQFPLRSWCSAASLGQFETTKCFTISFRCVLFLDCSCG